MSTLDSVVDLARRRFPDDVVVVASQSTGTEVGRPDGLGPIVISGRWVERVSHLGLDAAARSRDEPRRDGDRFEVARPSAAGRGAGQPHADRDGTRRSRGSRRIPRSYEPHGGRRRLGQAQGGQHVRRAHRRRAAPGRGGARAGALLGSGGGQTLGHRAADRAACGVVDSGRELADVRVDALARHRRPRPLGRLWRRRWRFWRWGVCSCSGRRCGCRLPPCRC